jgi:hypothetical protein
MSINILKPKTHVVGCRVQFPNKAAYALANYGHYLLPVGTFSLQTAYYFVKVCMQKIKSCDSCTVNLEFCRFHEEFNSSSRGF